jgi:GNAT superfamily N-acetyltransferase
MTQLFRLAQEADAPALAELLRKAYVSNTELGIHFAAAHADTEAAKKHIANNICYFLEEEGQLLGTISLRMPWGPNPGPAGVPHIGWLAVSPTAGKKGIGSSLLDFIEKNIARDQLKCPAVTLGTAVEHPWLPQLYEKRGYEKIAEIDLGLGHITAYFKKIIIKSFR